MRTKKGIVTSTKMDKTAVVTVSTKKAHPKYKKIYTISNKFHVNDPENKLEEGQIVTIKETKPQSKLKRWELIEIIK
jgi:small subunit ribosomal protein S17